MEEKEEGEGGKERGKKKEAWEGRRERGVSSL
jgi:hypothetical protein